jgi:hypothetical protein
MIYSDEALLSVRVESMANNTKKTVVNGGWIARNAKSGKFVAVGTNASTSKSNPKTVKTIKEVSSKRGVALQRLADR